MSERAVREYPFPGFGKTLRTAREAKGLTQVDVAQQVGVRKLVVSLWEREKNWPSDENLVKVCALFGLTPPLPERNAKGRRSIGRENCKRCGKSFPVYHAELYCSRACAYADMAERPSHNWKGGKQVTKAGYVLLYRPEHPKANGQGYILEHRLVAEEMIGRMLEKGEHVHHKNGDRADNRPENLEVWTEGSSARHRGARLSDVLLEAIRDEVRKIVREELAAAGIFSL